ncbi:MAG: HAD-IC family P-type ATPase [Rickettsiales bacterium]|jgi:Ca2+-transporting ATPase|nr:HAD-IC family P-type ATPase [Rickettsiales bacterium]
MDIVNSKGASKFNGLSEIEAAEKLKKYGYNSLPKSKNKNIILIFFEQFRDPLIYILLISACSSIFLGEHSDGIFIFSILIINSLIGCLQEYFAQKSVNSLKNMVKSRIVVIRDGIEKEIDSEYLVVGDLVLVKSGARVPADIVLLESENLEVNESMLTGESDVVRKSEKYVQKENCQIQDKFNEVFAGTIVTKGIFRGVVKSTGLNTEMGKIASTINQETEVKTPLLIRMEEFSKFFAILIAVAVFSIAVIAIIKGGNIRDILMMSIGLAVSAIPEALPITITIALSIGVIKMAKKNVIVKNMSAVEALGSCTTIASDKTGTLTQNEMQIVGVWYQGGNDIIPKKSSEAKNIDRNNYKNFSPEEYLLLTSVLANEAGENDGKFFGDSVDVAFLKYAENQGYNFREISNNFIRKKMLYYTSEASYSAAFIEIDSKTLVLLKGAPEAIFKMCSNDDVKNAEIKLQQLSDDGMRVLAVAYAKIEKKPNAEYSSANLKNMKFLALISLLDPLRDEAEISVKKCQGAGIDIVMITGDSTRTAYAIAKRLGFVENIDEVKSGLDIREALSKGTEALDELTRITKVYSRVEPIQKLEIVQSYMRNGNFVAVTGDGINDAPALKNANIGVAMGKSGTDIAKESADVILLDDNLASITNGIEEGRIVYNNIRKLIFFVVSCNIPEVVIYILAAIFGLPAPFSATQLLWLNVITEGIQNIFLAFEKGEGGEMTSNPRKPEEPIFDKIMKRRCIYSIVAMSMIYIGFYYISLRILHITQTRTASLLMLLFVFVQNFHAFNSRSENKSIFKHSIKDNKKLLFGVLAVAAIHLLAAENVAASRILKIEPLSAREIFIVFICASIVMLVNEVEKIIRNLNTAKNN